MLIDAHNHLQHPVFAAGRDDLLAALPALGIELCVVNATRESDWASVSCLCRAAADRLRPAYGLHPWYLSERTAEWREKLRQQLIAEPEASIGECGLDRWMPQPDLALQFQVLTEHARLARELERPLTIHCLRAWNELMQWLKQQPALPPFLLHSFAGPPALIPALAARGAYFSFSAAFLHPRKQQVLRNFSHIPADRLLLETDAPDMAPPQDLYPHSLPHGPQNLAIALHGLAAALGRDPAELAAETTTNARRFLHNVPRP